MSWKALAEAVGQFVGSLRVTFGAFLASSFLAYLYYDDHKWVLALPILFGGILLWDAVAAGWTPLIQRRDFAKAELHRIERKREKRETAIDDLTRDALAKLLIVRVKGVPRFNIDARSTADGEFSRSPLVRHIGHRGFWDGDAEYEVEDWAWGRLAEELDAIAAQSPQILARLQQMAGRNWRPE